MPAIDGAAASWGRRGAPGHLHHTHYDAGSLLTIGIMLSSTHEFEGGAFQTYEADCSMKSHPYEQGDAIVFPSHKFHSVAPILSGRRSVLITELWQGPERSCAHRCMHPRVEHCPFRLEDSKAAIATEILW